MIKPLSDIRSKSIPLTFRLRNIIFVSLVGIIIFAIFAKEIGLNNLLTPLNGINKPLILIAILFNLMNSIMFTITWRLLESSNIGFYKLFKIYMAGTFINNVTPTLGAGGEPIKAMLLGKEIYRSKSECFASVISQRMINMFPFLTIGIVGTVLLLSKPELKLGILEIAGLIFSIVAGSGIFITIIYFYRRKDKLLTFVLSVIMIFTPLIRFLKKDFDNRTYNDTVEKSIDYFHSGMKNIYNNKRGLIKAVIFSYIGWGFDILTIYTIFISIPGSYIHYSVLIIAYTISMLCSWLPLFLPGGIGIVDGTMAELFIVGGVKIYVSILATMLYRLASYWFNTLLGGFYLWDLYKE